MFRSVPNIVFTKVFSSLTLLCVEIQGWGNQSHKQGKQCKTIPRIIDANHCIGLCCINLHCIDCIWLCCIADLFCCIRCICCIFCCNWRTCKPIPERQEIVSEVEILDVKQKGDSRACLAYNRKGTESSLKKELFCNKVILPFFPPNVH